MANVNHSTLTDPYLHEPKGIASAGAGNIYVSDGAGSGDWTKGHAHINGYISFDATSPSIYPQCSYRVYSSKPNIFY